MQSEKHESWRRSWRRQAVLAGACAAFALAAGVEVLGRYYPGFATGRGEFTGNSLFRLGIVLGAFWLAMPSLARPLQWLPPVFATIILVCVGVVVIQPKFLLVLLPVALTAMSFAWIWRLLRLGKGG